MANPIPRSYPYQWRWVNEQPGHHLPNRTQAADVHRECVRPLCFHESATGFGLDEQKKQ